MKEKRTSFPTRYLQTKTGNVERMSVYEVCG